MGAFLRILKEAPSPVRCYVAGMAWTVTDDQWTTIRTAFKETGDRFAELLVTTRQPDAKAINDWTVATTAAHVTTIALLYTWVVRPEDTELPFPALADRLDLTTVHTVSELNDVALDHFTERDLAALAGHVRTHIDHILRATEDLAPTKPVAWIGGAQVPIAGILAHLINELQLHGHDIARATQRPWRVSSTNAALFFDMFLVGMLHNDGGRLLENGRAPSERRISVEFRSEYTSPATLVLHKGVLSVEEPGKGADVRLSFDPAVLIMMMFNRFAKARAVLTGKVVVSGRRPWLLPVFLRTVRMP
jgi:hypothetical protein